MRPPPAGTECAREPRIPIDPVGLAGQWRVPPDGPAWRWSPVRGTLHRRGQPGARVALGRVDLRLRQEDGAGEVSATQVGPAEVGDGQVGVAEVCGDEVGPTQVGGAQIRATQAGTDEVGTPPLDLLA